MNLFDGQNDHDLHRLLQAGWTETAVPGGSAWRHPGGDLYYSAAEALARLERDEREAKDVGH